MNGSFLVAQNDAENEQEGLLWSRYDWVFNESIPAPFEWGFCTAAWNASTQQEAAEAIGVNYNDIDAGCFGSPFTFSLCYTIFISKITKMKILTSFDFNFGKFWI